jgi:predicted nucleic acid binding AN1-type Zn finger protein
MASTDNADLMAIGAHCSQPGCGQVDFLPFKCDCCSHVFCLEHRTYLAHNCKLAGGKDTQVIVCPICAKSIKLAGDEDVHEAFEAHSRTSCDPSKYKTANNKPKCPVAGCRERLRDVNTYQCKICGLSVCLAHRFESDHACKGARLQYSG